MTSIRAAIVPVTPFEQNCTLVWCTATGEGVIVDPGGDVERIEAAIDQVKMTPTAIWLTHGHVDHAGGAADIAASRTLPVIGPHVADRDWLAQIPVIAAKYGIPGLKAVTPDRFLDEGETLTVGRATFDVLHCPGHSAGSVVFVNAEERFALVGDVVFRGSIGRTDFPGGDHATLIASIRDKLFPLGDDLAFVCGHGPGSTIGHERATNPFLR